MARSAAGAVVARLTTADWSGASPEVAGERWPGGIRNALGAVRDTPFCTVIFEPFGSEYELLSEDCLRIEVGGPRDGELEVVHRPGSILLWPTNGWG